ncbi:MULTISPECIES: SURF1 family protein [Luteimonas]|uniref:SURF1 family protein n=1 Tax=Luteimonas TaxID=83614 RepID=UPI000C7A5006|nr:MULTISPECIES: SURF1 family protein [Luteimonas]
MSRRTTTIVGWSLAVALIVAFAALGQWQLSRMHHKQAMLGAVERVLAERDAQPLALAGDAARAQDYDWVAGRGRFTDDRAFVLDNQIQDGQPGLRIYRLFAPEAGAPLLVDLGWAPIADRVTRLPAADIVSGAGLLDTPLELRGLLMPPPSAGLALGPALGEGAAYLMTRVDLAAIATAADLDTPPPPRVLRLDPALPLGYARDLDILPNTLPPEKHLGYAVQWFGLALAVLATALLLTFRKSRR